MRNEVREFFTTAALSPSLPHLQLLYIQALLMHVPTVKQVQDQVRYARRKRSGR